MDDKQLRARIDAVLQDHDRSLWRYWAQHIAVSSAAAGLALGLAACPPEWLPRGPDAGAVTAQPVLDPDITAEYAVQPDWRLDPVRSAPEMGQRIPVPPYAVSPPPPPPDAVPQALYAADIPRPPPAVRPVAKYAVAVEHAPQPADAIAHPVPVDGTTTSAGQAVPDVGAVARYAVRLPAPAKSLD